MTEKHQSHPKMIVHMARSFSDQFGSGKNISIAMAPGRVNLIGEYTDFNDGFVLPMTLDRGVYLAGRSRSDLRIRIASLRFDEHIEYSLDSDELPAPGSWASYVTGVVFELRKRGVLTHGFEAVVDGNLPIGAGLSSSAALEIATALLLQQIARFEMKRLDIIKMCQRVEHRYANVQCGIMDQFACGLGRGGYALLLDCRSLDYEDIAAQLGNYRIVIIDSKRKRALNNSAYNARRAECEEVVNFFQQTDSSIQSLRDISINLFERKSHGLSDTLKRRGWHVIGEIQRTSDAAKALKTGDLARFGTLMTASHTSLRDDFEVSCPELDTLVHLMNEQEGVLGSRLTGAGFGGCTVSLVHKDLVPNLADLLKPYTHHFDLVPSIHEVKHNLQANVQDISY